jgi:hypothetical protein
MSPPEHFVFEIIDKATGENLFANDTYKPEDIKIINRTDNSEIEYSFIDENDYNLIEISSIGWSTEIVNASVKIADKEIFSLYVDAELVSENCCSFTRYHEIEITGVEFVLDNTLGIYKILIE